MADIMDGAAVACKNVILHEKFKNSLKSTVSRPIARPRPGDIARARDTKNIWKLTK